MSQKWQRNIGFNLLFPSARPVDEKQGAKLYEDDEEEEEAARHCEAAVVPKAHGWTPDMELH